MHRRLCLCPWTSSCRSGRLAMVAFREQQEMVVVRRWWWWCGAMLWICQLPPWRHGGSVHVRVRHVMRGHGAAWGPCLPGPWRGKGKGPERGMPQHNTTSAIRTRVRAWT